MVWQRWGRLVAGVLAFVACGVVRADESLVVTGAQTAVLDPVQWDSVLAGERYFDAVRCLLVRFPGMAEAVHARLLAGEQVAKLELVLEWERQEGPGPERGRHGWGADEHYAAQPGEWHVIAHALLRPWALAEGVPGPTFNAWLDGLGYWERGGACGDGSDRHARREGPLPLHPVREKKSAPPAPAAPDTALGIDGDPTLTAAAVLDVPRAAAVPTARLDFTWVLQDEAFGATLSERLRRLDTQGFRVQKQEIRDMSYRRFWAYDWAVSIGYMRIWVKPPRLEVTFAPASGVPPPAPLPDAPDLAALAETLRIEGPRGTPSIALPADYAARVRAAWARPDGVPEWQWTRVLELKALSRVPEDTVIALGRYINWSALFSDDPRYPLELMRAILLIPPRTWIGHLSSDFALLPAAYPELLPPGVMDHLKLYWEAWLHPEVRSRNDIGGGNHRGGPSYFRGYSHGGGTMNFGHNAVMGALLGAQLIDAEYPLIEAQQGVENLLRRNDGLGTGAHQEIGDTYYQALSIAAAGAIAKYAEDPVTQLMGRFHRERLLEPLLSMYHPGLRRMTHPMGRGSFTYHLLLQEGPYHVLHTLSPQGVLMHLEDLKPPAERTSTPKTWGTVRGLPILGDEAPPARIAVISPWCDPALADAMAWLVDSKPFPWRIHARDYSPGCNGGGWHVNYLSRDYALASRDNANYDYGVTSIIAQWRRRDARVMRLDDLSTLLIGFGTNQEFMREAKSVGTFGVIQHDNKLIGLKNTMREEDYTRNPFGHLHAVHASAAILATGTVDDREVWVNDRRIDALSGPQPEFNDNWTQRITLGPEPVTVAAGDRILIRDGVTYIGLIPVTLNPQQRRRAAVISLSHPVLMIHAYLYDIDYVPPKRPQSPGASAALAAEAEKTLQGALDELLPDQAPRTTADDALLTPATFVAYQPLPELTPWSLTLPNGAALRADGEIGMVRAVVRPAANQVWIDQVYRPAQRTPDAPPCAMGMVLTGFAQQPQVTLNGRPLETLEAITVDGHPAYRVAF